MKKNCSGGQHRHIPYDILFGNILSRIPVKSLCRWKTVSKRWGSSIENIDKTRPKTQPLPWIRIPSATGIRRFNAVTRKYEYDTDIHIYSIDDDNRAVVQRYVPPPNTVFMKQYNNGGLICCYHDYLQLTLFNTITEESINVSLPTIGELIHDERVFEYAFDPLAKKYKVLTYKYGSRAGGWDPIDYKYSPISDFQILTLGGDSPTWRPVKELPEVKSLTNWVTIVDGTLFWYDDATQVISFSLAKEEFRIILKPKRTYHYFKRPLFEFEGSLFFVEKDKYSWKRQQEGLLKLNVWMLRDIEKSIWVLAAKNIALPLDGTRFLSYTVSMKNVEFSARTTELLIAAYDNVDQYVFSCGFLNMQCKRSKIIGQPFQRRYDRL